MAKDNPQIPSYENISETEGSPSIKLIVERPTDVATVHLEKGGIPSGEILIPIRYVHAYEVVGSILFLYYYVRSIRK